MMGHCSEIVCVCVCVFQDPSNLEGYCVCVCVCVFQDPSNLGAKLQQHQAFEAELQANKWRIDSVVEAGQQLTTDRHSASDTIQ